MGILWGNIRFVQYITLPSLKNEIASSDLAQCSVEITTLTGKKTKLGFVGNNESPNPFHIILFNMRNWNWPKVQIDLSKATIQSITGREWIIKSFNLNNSQGYSVL